MSKKERKLFQQKLITAVKKVLKANDRLLTAKFEKVVKKSIQRIVKKSRKQLTPLKKAAVAVQ